MWVRSRGGKYTHKHTQEQWLEAIKNSNSNNNKNKNIYSMHNNFTTFVVVLVTSKVTLPITIEDTDME